ncbi:MAG: TIR domain-containing protein [Firmicutes bacterium]|nr:TIR domain-containing protein [Bacillota bacterium]
MEYHLFISHSWKYPNAYEGLVSLLDKDYWFSYKDYSVPRDEPLPIYNKMYYESELRNKIINQMRTCHVVLILAGVYASYSDSINMEIEIANELGKPIIAIQPWGAEKTSQIVKNNSKVIVGWNSSSIIDAIKRYSL